MEWSGAVWCDRFPGSTSIEDLVDPFREGVRNFVEVLEEGEASVHIAATRRPRERAYLMHFCCLVAGYRDQQNVFHQIAPPDVPSMIGVDIDWTCGGDGGVARAAAVAMRQKYEIDYPAALNSNHVEGRAIDMKIRWQGSSITLPDKQGILHLVNSQSDLWPIGKSYGVIKLVTDEPHWSYNGH